MPLEFDVKITHKDMYKFNLYHAYTGFHGIFGTIIGILVLIVAFVTRNSIELTYTMLYFLFGVLFLVYTPVSLWGRCKRQMLLSPALQETLHYSMDDDGIHVVIGEQSADLEWKMIYKIMSTKNYLLIYSTRIYAYIIPLNQLGNQYDAIKKMAEQNLEKYRLRLK